MAEHSYDVVIIGGGAAGSAAALTLRQLGVQSVCIVEGSDFAEARVGETIPPDTNLLLRELGVDRSFASQKHLPCYGSQSLWGGPQLGHNDFLTSPYGHGWHLDRAEFDRMLLAQAVAAGVTRMNARCDSVACTKDRVSGILAGGQRIKAGTYIDATGRSAIVLRALGVGHRFDDRQTVIWARFDLPGPVLGHSTWLESAPNGWWYAAEVPGGASVVALGTDPRLAKSAGLYNLPPWAVALSGTRLIAPRLAQARLAPDSFRITASHSYRAERCAGANWIAVGDAATGLDPLSSAGIYKALSTGQQAARAVVQEGGMAAYTQRVGQDYDGYLIKRAELYQSEQRWPQNGFWAARQSVPEQSTSVFARSF